MIQMACTTGQIVLRESFLKAEVGELTDGLQFSRPPALIRVRSDDIRRSLSMRDSDYDLPNF